MFNNYQPNNRIITNYDVISNVLRNLEPTMFNLKRLSDIFEVFLKQIEVQNIYFDQLIQNKNSLLKDLEYKKMFNFPFDGYLWTGTIVQYRSENDWYTLTIKLPNDGYLYDETLKYVNSEGKGCMHLDYKHFPKLQPLLNFTGKIFSKYIQNDCTEKIFYLSWEQRLNYKVKCAPLKMWLEITFENGPPYDNEKQKYWYSRNELEQLMKEKNL